MRLALAFPRTIFALVAFWALFALSAGAKPADNLPEPFAVPFCMGPDGMPYHPVDRSDLLDGIAADLLTSVAVRSRLRMKLVPTGNWEESLEALRSGRCLFVGMVEEEPGLSEWLSFTDPIYTDPGVVLARDDHPFVDDLTALKDETLVLPKNTNFEGALRTTYPNLKYVMTDTYTDAFALIAAGRASLTVRPLADAVYAINNEEWSHLQVVGHLPGLDTVFRIGVRKGHPELLSALNRGIATLTAHERHKAAARQLSRVVTLIDYGPVRTVALGFSLVLLTSLFWALKLKQLNTRLRIRSRTDPLTGLANRGWLNERLEQEIARARRHGNDLSVVLVDIDHFKAVNDGFGHLMGDRVLVAVARLLKADARCHDTVGRWGGEEFLIICPETDAAGALALAQRLCGTMRAHCFETSRCHTVSIGVAQWKAADTGESLVRRADTALYKAKTSGRNRAVLDVRAS